MAKALLFWATKPFQLTWKSGEAFSYDLSNPGPLELSNSFSYEGEGWGLTTLNDKLLMSDGTSSIKFINPNTFSIEKSLVVREGANEIDRLNELEVVDNINPIKRFWSQSDSWDKPYKRLR